MKLVTLISDLGLKDHYVGALKGMFHSQINDITLVDISHNVQPFNIAQAAYYVNNSWHRFPKGTVHFINVDSTPLIHIGKPDANTYPVLMVLKGHYFIGCDNGIFSLIEGYEEAEKIIQLDFSAAGKDLRHPAEHIYIPAIKEILDGKKPESIGEEIAQVKKVFTAQPTIEKDLIKGSVIHIDQYGNVISNITEELFQKIGQGNQFTIFFKNSNYFIEQVSATYSDVPMGEKLALFNENGLLEIAINKGTPATGGGASSLLGLKIRDMVRVEFHPPGSKNRIQDLFAS